MWGRGREKNTKKEQNSPLPSRKLYLVRLHLKFSYKFSRKKKFSTFWDYQGVTSLSQNHFKTLDLIQESPL